MALSILLAGALAGCSAESVHHQLHWMVYGHDRVWYHERTYLGPATESRAHLESEYGALQETGEKVLGMPVLNTAAGAASPYVPTVLMLEQNSQTCIVYALSGGP